MIRGLLIFLLLGAGLFGLYKATLTHSNIECEACVIYHGHPESCARVSADSMENARSQAMSTACSTVAGGVTEVIECGAQPPSRFSCTDPGTR